jgi:superfamily II DNA or RNA helicase
MDIITKYKAYIFERFYDLQNSSAEFDNYDLAKIFEYYCCIKLFEETGQEFFEYNDIPPDFKEQHQMSKNDTGIDLCNMIDTIVQCKLRKNNLTWQELGTFFGSNMCVDETGLKNIIKWDKMIIARNLDSKLSANLKNKRIAFTDKLYDRTEMLDYCKKLLDEKIHTELIKKKIVLRDYQIECIDLIQKSDRNVVICLPTGSGKNVIMIHSFEEDSKYLILVPRIILMEQLYDEIVKYNRKLKKNIQLIGGGNNTFDKDKKITICVYNSVEHVLSSLKSFDKIYIDEAHHVYKPEIYDSDEESQDKYLRAIRKFSKYNNNVYLSATIDEIEGFDFYKKELRDMIDEKYLSDYTIHIPVFSIDPSNKNICQYLLRNYRNIIVYCNSRSEGKQVVKLFNELQDNNAEYIDCDTTKTDRKDILKRYNEGNIPFLVNVRVLCEGFDSAITRGVCFLHLLSSKTTVIQIIGRALRLHPLKTIANVILPFSLTEDEKSISNFMKILAGNDRRIKQSYKECKEGGYINITKDAIENDECELRYEMIYNSLGNDIRLTWNEWKDLLFKYCNENKKIPSAKEQYENVNLGKWFNNQKTKINNPEDQLYKLLAENKYVKMDLDRYLEIKNKNKDKNKLTFDELKEMLFNYCNENKKMPPQKKQYENVNLGKWYSNQKRKITSSEDELYKFLAKNKYVKIDLDKKIAA